MPRACPVESHARHYKEARALKEKMPRACPVESRARHSETLKSQGLSYELTARHFGDDALLTSAERETPRGKPVASSPSKLALLGPPFKACFPG